MSDQNPSSFLGSPRVFHGFFARNNNISDSENYKNGMSPTSILPSFVNPFGYDSNISNSSTPSNQHETLTVVLNKSSADQQQQAIGLANLIDSFIDKEEEEKNGGNYKELMMNSSSSSSSSSSEAVNRMQVLLGSKLKVHIPDHVSNSPSSSSLIFSPIESPKSPADFGIKTRSNVVVSHVSNTTVPSYYNNNNNSSKKEFSRQLSLKEMELSEDYTCVITHGPNPKTTHIFDDCIVQRCIDGEYLITDDVSPDHKKLDHQSGCEINSLVSSNPSADFTSFCHNCKKVLLKDQDKEIYIYRDETAFCCQECRCQEMISEVMKNSELDGAV